MLDTLDATVISRSESLTAGTQINVVFQGDVWDPGRSCMASKRNLRREVTRALVADGFVRGKHVHVKRLDDDWSLLVDTGELGENPGIAPVIGIRHDRVETLLQQLCALPLSAGTGTVAANVGYVIDGTYRHWLPPLLPGMPPVKVEDVLAAIRAGLTRLSEYLRLDRVPAAWEAIPASQDAPSCAYRRVIVQLLLHEAAGVEREMARAEHQYCVRDDEICADFRAFRTRVLALGAV